MTVDNKEVATRSAFILAACVSAAIVLTSCGSKPVPKPQNQAQPQTAAKPQTANEPRERTTPLNEPRPDQRPVIVAFGDSLTQGVSGKSYPAFLQDLLDKNGYAYRVDNQGVSGDTTIDGLARIDNVVAAKPALVVLEFGGNDGLRGIPVESTKQNLEEMIRRLQSEHLPLVLAGITLPPNYGADYVGPFTAMYPALAGKYKLRFIPFLLSNVYNKSGMMQPDGIHPSEDGNRVVAQDVFELIEPLLKRT
jgi:acyl-CoA thioesterase I